MWKKWIWLALIGISLAVLFYPEKPEVADKVLVAPAGEQVFVVSTMKSLSRAGFSGGELLMRNEIRLLSDSGEISKPMTSVFGQIVNLTAFENKLWLFWQNGGAATMDLNSSRGGIVSNQEATPALLPKNWTVPVEAATIHGNALRIFGRQDNNILTAAYQNGAWNEPEIIGLPKPSADAPTLKALRDNERLAYALSDGKERLLLVWCSQEEKREDKNIQRLSCGLVDFTAKQIEPGKPLLLGQFTRFGVYAGSAGQFYCLQIIPPPNMLSQEGRTFKSFVFRNNSWEAEPLPKEAFSNFPADMSYVAGWNSDGRDFLAVQSKNGPKLYVRQNNRWVIYGKSGATAEKPKSGILMFAVGK